MERKAECLMSLKQFGQATQAYTDALKYLKKSTLAKDKINKLKVCQKLSVSKMQNIQIQTNNPFPTQISFQEKISDCKSKSEEASSLAPPNDSSSTDSSHVSNGSHKGRITNGYSNGHLVEQVADEETEFVNLRGSNSVTSFSTSTYYIDLILRQLLIELRFDLSWNSAVASDKKRLCSR